MKIGIVTFQRAYNYGAVLQAYALCHKIRNLGFLCEVVDYHCERFEHDYKKISVFNVRSFRELISAIVNGKTRNKKRAKFIDFVEHEIPLSSNKYYSDNITDSNKEYDVFITGSDQVWNLKLTDGDWHFFLDFVNPERKKISYAASIVAINNDNDVEIKRILDSFSHISLREISGMKYLSSLGFNNTKLVLDPTLLLTKEEWTELASKYLLEGLLPKQYLLAYFVSPTQSNYEQMKNLSKEVNLPIVLINYTHRKVDEVINLTTISPGQFVKLFMNATFIITNSFHGTAFSINLNKEFVYVLNTEKPEKNERINTLVDLLELTDRDFRFADINNRIDWMSVNQKLEELRRKSIDILQDEIVN
jgi:hypothetical protein